MCHTFIAVFSPGPVQVKLTLIPTTVDLRQARHLTLVQMSQTHVSSRK